MRPIDADALKPYRLNEHYKYRLVYDADDVANTPTIDAVSVVRCKGCRYWEMRNSPRGWCVVHQGYVSPQYFCADGERKSDD